MDPVTALQLCNDAGVSIVEKPDTPGLPINLAGGINLGFYAYLLKEERERRGLSRKELAAVLRVSPSQITRWEQGETIPSAENLLLFSLFVGKNPYYFFSCGAEIDGTDLRGGLAELLKSSVGSEEAAVVAMMRWLSKEDRSRIAERTQALAEQQRPGFGIQDLMAPLGRYDSKLDAVALAELKERVAAQDRGELPDPGPTRKPVFGVSSAPKRHSSPPGPKVPPPTNTPLQSEIVASGNHAGSPLRGRRMRAEAEKNGKLPKYRAERAARKEEPRADPRKEADEPPKHTRRPHTPSPPK